MNQAIIIHDPFDKASIEVTQTHNVLAHVMSTFGHWPDDAHIYFNHVCAANDVTPQPGCDFDRLLELQGRFLM